MSNIALKLTMVMPAVLLQKPSRKSTSKQHSEYLNKRLGLWEDGKFDELMKEAREIQHAISRPKSKHETADHKAKVFTKLMRQGKVHAALRILDQTKALGIAEMNDNTISILKNLHPAAKETHESTLMEGELPYFDPVIFTNIDEAAIATAALRGGAGPSGMDADGWRRLLISKNYGVIGRDLRNAIAKITQNLCTREVRKIENSMQTNVESFTANRLIRGTQQLWMLTLLESCPYSFS